MLFQTIVVDPPWRYRGNACVGDGGRGGVPKSAIARGSGAAAHYETLTNEQIRGMNVGEFAADNAYLFLWITNSFLLEPDHPARSIPLAWGFRPVTVVTWAKHHKEDPATPSRKTGTYFRGATEHVVFCVRGKLPMSAAPATWFGSPRGRHSEKPDEFYRLVETVAPGPYLDVFARKIRPGWTSWGNEVPGGPNIVVS